MSENYQANWLSVIFVYCSFPSTKVLPMVVAYLSKNISSTFTAYKVPRLFRYHFGNANNTIV